MRTLRIVLASILIFILTPIWATASPRTATTSLTSTGERAIQDLRRCLGANDNLDVYYLIDKSGSLSDTDPLNLRSEVLSDSLTQLAGLTEAPSDLQVSWSAAFFDDDFYAASDQWFDLDTENANESAQVLASAVRSVAPGGRTNWLSALTSAQIELAKQKRSTNGCQVLIWLTDGGLNVQEDDSKSFAAMNSLCGQLVVPGGSPPALGNGPLYELRQTGVTVFGVLLDVVGPGIQDSYQERKTWMQALVEGSGEMTVEGATRSVNCGDGSGTIPSNHSAGAYIRAQSAADLSIQFLRLAGVVRGGSTSSINPDGSFSINPGVASVTILTLEPASKIQLFDVSGDSALNSEGVTVVEKAGATAIEVTVDSVEDFGRWKILGTAPADTVLIAFSALTIEPSSQNALITGTPSEIVLDATVSNNSLFSLNDYRFNFAVYQVDRDGTLSQVASGDQTAFQMSSLAINLTPASGATEVRLRFEVDGLSTTVGQTRLASIVAEQSLVVSLPDSFPTFGPVPLDLGLLSGRLKAATGQLVVRAPVSGEAGSFCLPDPETVTILSDSIDRAQTWSWGFSTESEKNSDGCYTLESGETATIQISSQNSVTANSEVHAEAKIVLKDSAGASLEVDLPMDLESERVINPFVYTLVTILLTLLALILPLIVLYLINKATTKVEHGNELLRATFPVTTDLTNDNIQGTVTRDLKGPEIGLDQFKFLGPKPDASSFDISDQFKAVARVSLNPFVAPWFELQAKDGFRVFTAKSGKKSKRFVSGERAEFGGQLSKLWVVSVRETDLLNATSSTTELPGTLTVFDRNSAGASPDFQERMVNVVNEAKLRSRVLEAGKSIGAQVKSKSGKSAKTEKNQKTPSAPRKPAAPPAGPGTARPGYSAPPTPPSGKPSAPNSGPSGPPMPPTGPKGPPSSPPTLS